MGDTDLGFFGWKILRQLTNRNLCFEKFFRVFVGKFCRVFVGDSPSRVVQSFGHFRQIYFTTEDGDNAEVVS